MKRYKAFVKERETGKPAIVTSEYDRKTDFIHDLRRNGYKVDPDKVKTAELFDYIMSETNAAPWDWKENTENTENTKRRKCK